MSAQTTTSSIAGTVRDASGAVLPGVTVEAASPALIEKVRSVVTDGEGRFNIVDLRVGAYTVTFMLPGFNTFRREGVELTSGFTATVNATLSVGSLEETITVTGESPLVDVQNVRSQNVVSNELLQALPAGDQSVGVLVTLTPGMTGPANVGGSLGAYRAMSANTAGYRGRVAMSVTFDGMGILNMESDGNAGYILNSTTTEEMVLETGGISAESAASGFATNAIPREGGNVFNFRASALYSNNSMQADNLDDELRAGWRPWTRSSTSETRPGRSAGPSSAIECGSSPPTGSGATGTRWRASTGTRRRERRSTRPT